MDFDHNAAPINPLPWAVWLLVLPIAALEIAFDLGEAGMIGGPAAAGWRVAVGQDYSFWRPTLDWMLETHQLRFEVLIRFFSYAFLHVDAMHALFVVVMTMAMGKFVGEVFNGFALLAVFLVSAAAGALAYGLLGNSDVPLIGGFPGVYGLIGAFTFILWVRLGAVGANRVRAFTLIGFLMFIQFAFGLLFGGSRVWIADIGAFAAGFALSFVVSPGGPARVLALLRER